MKHRTHLVLLATLVAGPAWAQDVTATSTTIAQSWKQATPGFGTSSFTPATEYVGVDAVRLGGNDHLSFHLYGWGRADLADQSAIGGKNAGDLTYGYLQYDFGQANAQLKAGRFTVNQGVGNEQVDGVSARTDLRYGFTVSAFAGKPVVYKNLGSQPQTNMAFQQDVIYGARLSWRTPRLGELGVDYLQDGTTNAAALPQPVDYTRRQLGVDLSLVPCSYMDFSGRTVFDVNNSNPATANGAETSHIAEDDYKATVKLPQNLSLTANFVERNFYAYFAGSTLPNLFNQNDQGMLRAVGGTLAWAPVANLQVAADVRSTRRPVYGEATRAGGDVRYTFAEPHVLAGAGYHQVNAFNVAVAVVPAIPSYSLSHNEMRAWVMADRGALSASLDIIRLHYDDAQWNPNLNGKSIESDMVGSLGYQAKNNLKVSGDLSLEDNPIYNKQVMGLVRVEYRFGLAGKGGK